MITIETRGPPVASGRYGIIHQAFDRTSCKNVALKVIPKMRPDLVQTAPFAYVAKKEADLAKSLPKNKGLVEVHYTYEDNDHVYIVMEWCKMGSLHNVVQRSRRKLMSRAGAYNVARQLLDGLKAMHADGILHGDVKPENIVMSSPTTVKLCDFGCSEEGVDFLTGSFRRVCTPWYAAPEMFISHEHGLATDIWALGATLNMLLHGDMRKCQERPDSFIGMCMAPSPHDRPTAAEALRIVQKISLI